MEDNPALMSRDYSILRIARLMSRQSNARNFKFGSVLANGRKIIGVGSNDVVKTHPKSTTMNSHIHAELSAILNARSDVSGSTLYVFRAGRKERPLLAKPCKNCQALLIKQGIRFVVYSIDGGYTKVSVSSFKENHD
jgi:deoxycytidylate deaminase